VWMSDAVVAEAAGGLAPTRTAGEVEDLGAEGAQFQDWPVHITQAVVEKGVEDVIPAPRANEVVGFE